MKTRRMFFTTIAAAFTGLFVWPLRKKTAGSLIVGSGLPAERIIQIDSEEKLLRYFGQPDSSFRYPPQMVVRVQRNRISDLEILN